ncbi:MAG: nucleotide-binding protein [Thermodesulfovibrionales bacterium]
MNLPLLLDGGSYRSQRGCEIWAIAGGKGGTGKSFITSSVGSYLAGAGKRVILVDADLGGANLHSFLGISRPRHSLSDFFDSKSSLGDLVVNAGISDLGLISGDLHSLDSDNVKHAQKQKLHRHMRGLDADYVLVDLGAGSHYNTIDTFLLADKMIMVIVPEITAIENMYQYLKNVLFRKLKGTLAEYGLKEIVQDAWKKRSTHNIKNLRDLIDYLRGVSANVRDILDRELSPFRIYLVLNQVRSNQDIAIGASVKSVCIKYFGIHAHYVGYVEYDDCIWGCVNRRQPFLRTYPSTRCAKELGRVAENLLDRRELKLAKV